MSIRFFYLLLLGQVLGKGARPGSRGCAFGVHWRRRPNVWPPPRANIPVPLGTYDTPDIPNMWMGPNHGKPYYDGSPDHQAHYTIYCGIFGTGNQHWVRDATWKFLNSFDRCSTDANSCKMHYNWGNTGIWVCNGNNYTLDIPCANVGWMADRLDHFCCHEDGGKSGQMFHFNDKYQVIIGHNQVAEDGRPGGNTEDNGHCVGKSK